MATQSTLTQAEEIQKLREERARRLVEQRKARKEFRSEPLKNAAL
jgi:hypothetical protein